MSEPNQTLAYESPPVPKTTGVYFRHQDSPGMFVRVLIAFIDVAVAAGIMIGLAIVVNRLLPLATSLLITLVSIFAAWMYLVVLKRTGAGTLGYSLLRVKVTDLHGQRPGLVRLTLRLLLGLGFNPVLDMVFLASDTARQTLRDKLAGTYVVKRRAVVEGHGELAYANLFFMNMALVYREVKRRD